MTERLPPSISAMVIEDEKRYFVALLSPVARTSESYYHLRRRAEAVLYPDGRQVFVFARDNFGTTVDEQEHEVVDFAYQALRSAGIMPDIAIHPISELSDVLNGTSHG